jgi:crotonobetainyl-CoA:carnitine CoA-transferase CaiB-like acyl-CoA transferase
MTKPLDGIRVLDLSRLYPGPYCSMILADFGAEVLCIEDRRYASEPAMPSVMRNKRHMSLDLGTAGGREVFLRLVRGADVLLEGFRPEAMKRLGLDYPALRQENPRLVYCSVTGFGQTGPYRDMVGHDLNYLALGGVLATTGTGPEALPAIPGTQIADVAAGGMNAAIGILLALLARERSGEGQYVDVSMTDGIVAMNGYAAVFLWALGESLQPGRSMLTGKYPWYRVYRCADGRDLSIGAVERRFWERLCEHFGVPEWASLQYHDEKAPEMHAFFEARFAEKSRDTWFEELRSLDVCVAPVLDPREAFESQQVKARDLVVDVEKDGQRLKLLGVPIKLSATPGSIESPPPGFGEHTDEVLSSLGYDAEAIARLRRSGDVS